MTEKVIAKAMAMIPRTMPRLTGGALGSKAVAPSRRAMFAPIPKRALGTRPSPG